MLARSLELLLDPAAIMTRAGMPPDPWQAAFLRARHERTLLLCSRQSGKSTVTAAMALYEALFRPGALVLLLSPSLRQSQELSRKVRDFQNRIGVPVPVAEESALRLELTSGSRIVALPGTEETVRGFSDVQLLVVDEAARVEDALYFSVRPMLAVSGGRMVCLTTPSGKRGFFYEEWSGANNWNRIQVTGRECPRISKKFLEEERTSLGDWWFRQEYECVFSDTSDQFFRTVDVERAFTDEVTPLYPEVAGASRPERTGDDFLEDIPTLPETEP